MFIVFKSLYQSLLIIEPAKKSSSCISLELSGEDRCGGCRRWAIDGIKVRKARWNTAQIQHKCDRGLHMEEFYQNLPVADSQSLDGNVDVMDVDSDAE
jgi:hypothetical protein